MTPDALVSAVYTP
jgi:hypothetical protein